MKVHYRRRRWVASVPSGSGGAAKEGESTSARERTMREGLGILLEGNQEGICRRYLEGWGGGALGHVGKSNVAGNTDGYRIEHITK